MIIDDNGNYPYRARNKTMQQTILTKGNPGLSI
jgi:hypothetical protein